MSSLPRAMAAWKVDSQKRDFDIRNLSEKCHIQYKRTSFQYIQKEMSSYGHY